MDHYNFEARIPLDHAMHIVAMVRAGELLEKKSEALMCIGSATGEIGALLGQYEVPTPFGAFAAEMSIEEVCEELEAKVQVMEVAEPSSIDPATIALILQLAQLAFKWWSSR